MASWPPWAAYMSAVLPSLLVSDVSALSSSRHSTSRLQPRWAAKSNAVLPWPFWKSMLAPALHARSASRAWTPSWSFHLPLASRISGVSPFSSVVFMSPPFSMEASAVLTSFWFSASSSILPYFLGFSLSAIMSLSSWDCLALSCGIGSPVIFSRQFFSRPSGSMGSTFTMSPADLPRWSSSVASAPASRSIFVRSLLLCLAAIISGVWPWMSFMLRSALASMTICSSSLEPRAMQQWAAVRPVRGCGQLQECSSSFANAFMISPFSMASQSSAALDVTCFPPASLSSSSRFCRALSISTSMCVTVPLLFGSSPTRLTLHSGCSIAYSFGLSQSVDGPPTPHIMDGRKGYFLNLLMFGAAPLRLLWKVCSSYS
mmetsp:Transcript_85887/g.243572  ORF Transcript_85887/g.243572 Transcript_85887/m.243572 type:complete len:373 (+) Transcript_85887:504-1622(+)